MLLIISEHTPHVQRQGKHSPYLCFHVGGGSKKKKKKFLGKVVNKLTLKRAQNKQQFNFSTTGILALLV